MRFSHKVFHSIIVSICITILSFSGGANERSGVSDLDKRIFDRKLEVVLTHVNIENRCV